MIQYEQFQHGDGYRKLNRILDEFMEDELELIPVYSCLKIAIQGNQLDISHFGYLDIKVMGK